MVVGFAADKRFSTRHQYHRVSSESTKTGVVRSDYNFTCVALVTEYIVEAREYLVSIVPSRAGVEKDLRAKRPARIKRSLGIDQEKHTFLKWNVRR